MGTIPRFEGGSLAEARQWFDEQLSRGAVCPCCGKFSTRDRRSLSRPMVAALRLLERYDQEHPGGPCRFEAFIQKTGSKPTLRGDVAKLEYWGLAERVGHGLYQITAAGKKFLAGEIAVQKAVIYYNGQMLGFDGPHVSAKDYPESA